MVSAVFDYWREFGLPLTEEEVNLWTPALYHDKRSKQATRLGV